MTESTEIIIILVHGTFARKAPWCQVNSFFRNYLDNKLKIPVNYIEFLWTGDNSHEARLNGGLELRSEIEKIRTSNAESSIFIIGHSHGGNVIRYALNDNNTAAYVKGVVTLGTPFICIEPRMISKQVDFLGKCFIIQALLISFVIFVIAVLFLEISINNREESQVIMKFATNHYIGSSIVFGILAILRIIYLNLVEKKLNKFHENMLNLQSSILNRVSFPKIDGIPILSVIARFDEAGLLLNSASSISELFFIGFSHLLTRIALIFLLFPFTIIIIARLVGIINNFNIDNLSIVYISTLVVVVFFLPIFVFGSILLSMFASQLKRKSFESSTKKNSIQDWLVNASTCGNPEDWTPNDFHSFYIQKNFKNIFRTLLHSMIYEHPPALDAISEWIKFKAIEHRQPVNIYRRIFTKDTLFDWESYIKRLTNR